MRFCKLGYDSKIRLVYCFDKQGTPDTDYT